MENGAENTMDNAMANGHQGKARRIRTPALPKNRSRRGKTRRFNLLCSLFAAEIGRPLTLIETEVIRQCASLMVQAEGMQAAILDGADVDVDHAVRLTGEVRRTISALVKRAAAAAAEPQPTLREYLEALRDQTEAAEDDAA